MDDYEPDLYDEWREQQRIDHEAITRYWTEQEAAHADDEDPFDLMDTPTHEEPTMNDTIGESIDLSNPIAFAQVADSVATNNEETPAWIAFDRIRDLIPAEVRASIDTADAWQAFNEALYPLLTEVYDAGLRRGVTIERYRQDLVAGEREFDRKWEAIVSKGASIAERRSETGNALATVAEAPR
ncbi:MAG: hypothetical protein QM753_12040 [Thermomicrobiales bacterium]